jgi:hypothetical protein
MEPTPADADAPVFPTWTEALTAAAANLRTAEQLTLSPEAVANHTGIADRWLAIADRL